MYMMYESGAKPIVFVLYCAFKKEMGRGQWLNVEQTKTYIKWLTVEDLFINFKKKSFLKEETWYCEMLISQKVLFCVGRTKEGPMLEEKNVGHWGCYRY